MRSNYIPRKANWSNCVTRLQIANHCNGQKSGPQGSKRPPCEALELPATENQCDHAARGDRGLCDRGRAQDVVPAEALKHAVTEVEKSRSEECYSCEKKDQSCVNQRRW